MTTPLVSRRSFLEFTAGSAVSAAWLAEHSLLDAADAPKTVRLGAPVFGVPKNADPEAVAVAHRKLGYRAAYCPAVKLDDADRIRDITRAYAKHDVIIAEVGRWVNLMDADESKRSANLTLVTEGLALAEAVGARCCVDIAGSFSTEKWSGPHPDNLSRKFFDLAVENARKIIDAVKPKRAKFCYEMMGWALPDSPASYLDLIKAIGREGFGVHLDPCNLVNSPVRYYHNAAVIQECFDRLGPHIVSCHAKDMAWDVEMTVRFREVPIGQGVLDFGVYLKRLAALAGDVPLMIEHMKNAEEYDACRNRLLEVAKGVGVSFGT